jgi:TPR repeat protein
MVLSKIQLLAKARQGDPRWQIQYVERLLSESKMRSDDVRDILLFLQLAARQAYAPALFKLAECYEQGSIVAFHRKRALHYYLEAAKLNNAGAQYEVGKRSAYGFKGLPRDIHAGVQWLQLAARQKHAKALYRLAMLHREGYVCGTINCDHVVPFISLAAELGHPRAQFKAATELLKHTDETALAKAITYLTAAAKAGLLEAHLRLGLCLLAGRGVSKNPTKALRHLQLATDFPRNGEADYVLALCYLGGVVVENDMVQATEHLKKAVLKGEHVACLLLGRILEHPPSAPRGHLNSSLCYAKLTRGPLKMRAFYFLSECYEKGCGGVEEDIDISIDYLCLAAYYGHVQAKVRLGYKAILGQISQDKLDLETGLRYLEEAIVENDPAALAFVSILYSNHPYEGSRDHRRGYDRAFNFYQRALSLTRAIARK